MATSTYIPAALLADEQEAAARKNAWWVEALQGVALTIFGAGVVFSPLLTLGLLVYFIGTLLIVFGVLDILYGIFSISKNSAWVTEVVLGALSVMAGVFVVHYPIASAVTYVYLLGFFLLLRGVLKLVLPIRLPELRALSVMGGVCSILLGIILLANPVSGGLIYFWVTGLFALIAGPIEIAVALRTRHMEESAARAERERARERRGLPAHA